MMVVERSLAGGILVGISLHDKAKTAGLDDMEHFNVLTDDVVECSRFRL